VNCSRIERSLHSFLLKYFFNFGQYRRGNTFFTTFLLLPCTVIYL